MINSFILLHFMYLTMLPKFNKLGFRPPLSAPRIFVLLGAASTTAHICSAGAQQLTALGLVEGAHAFKRPKVFFWCPGVEPLVHAILRNRLPTTP